MFLKLSAICFHKGKYSKINWSHKNAAIMYTCKNLWQYKSLHSYLDGFIFITLKSLGKKPFKFVKYGQNIIWMSSYDKIICKSFFGRYKNEHTAKRKKNSQLITKVGTDCDKDFDTCSCE